jgi:biopolymer transport protein ExbD
MIFKEREREDPRIQLTGLVDILFLLIIFFTVTTTFATTGGINVDLPEASAQRPLEKTQRLFVVINKDGDAFIEGEKMSNRKLVSSFKKTAETDADAVVIMQADKRTAHGRVVEVMDMAQGAGLKRLAIAAEQKPPEREQEESPPATREEDGETPPGEPGDKAPEKTVDED